MADLLETVSVCSRKMADLAERVAAKIAEMERYLARTGGHVELLDVEDAIARIRVPATRPRLGRLGAPPHCMCSSMRDLIASVPPHTTMASTSLSLPPGVRSGSPQPSRRRLFT